MCNFQSETYCECGLGNSFLLEDRSKLECCVKQLSQFLSVVSCAGTAITPCHRCCVLSATDLANQQRPRSSLLRKRQLKLGFVAKVWQLISLCLTLGELTAEAKIQRVFPVKLSWFTTSRKAATGNVRIIHSLAPVGLASTLSAAVWNDHLGTAASSQVGAWCTGQTTNFKVKLQRILNLLVTSNVQPQ